MANFDILECTLRDGSYAVDFQFTAADTVTIVSELDKVGFKYIEVGHGVGLGASEKGKGIASETDESYMQAAAFAIKNAKWGMFCIPGIASKKHLKLASEYKMDFIRIGANVLDYHLMDPFIDIAKQHGMMVCANFMKTYTTTPKDFSTYVLRAEQAGADLVYIVDSAGGLLPNQIKEYVAEIRNVSDTVKLGFHGHNNLGLGVANSLAAVEVGVSVIDTSVQGLGRSAGNTPTEQFVCAALRSGFEVDIDLLKLLRLSEKHVLPFVKTLGLSALDTLSGFSLFHSSFLPIIEKYAKQYEVDPLLLLMEVAHLSQSELTHEFADEVAKKIASSKIFCDDFSLFRKSYVGDELNYEKAD